MFLMEIWMGVFCVNLACKRYGVAATSFEHFSHDLGATGHEGSFKRKFVSEFGPPGIACPSIIQITRLCRLC